MATLDWSFFRLKPKPTKPATSAYVRTRVDALYKGKDAPSDDLRDDFRHYNEIKNRIRRAA